MACFHFFVQENKAGLIMVTDSSTQNDQLASDAKKQQEAKEQEIQAQRDEAERVRKEEAAEAER